MPTRHFLIHYPDGSKEQVGRKERDEELLAGNLEQIDSKRYKFIGRLVTVRGLAQLGQIYKLITKGQRSQPDAYPGTFIWQLGSKRHRERLESPEALAIRIQTHA